MVRRLTLLLLLAACEEGEWTREVDAVLPGAHGDGHVSVLVVDARTRRPLAGASLRFCREDVRPEGMPGRFVGELSADAYGIVSFRWDPKYRDCHWVFDHEGYAAVDEYAGVERVPVVALEPGVDVSGRLLDPREKPAAGVEVEYYLGCPHSPAVRRATTDAQGRFVLRDVAPSVPGTLWAPFDDAKGAMVSCVRTPHVAPSVGTIRTEAGYVYTGRVVDARNAPVQGAVVWSDQTPRGPKTLTSADGSFRLPGVAGDAKVATNGARFVQLAKSKPRGMIFRPAKVRTVRARPPGDPSKYRLGFDLLAEAGENGVFVLRTRHAGRLRLRFEHEDFGSGRIAVDVDADSVDVGPDAFPAPGRLRVVDAAGKLVEESTLHVYEPVDGDGFSEDGPEMTSFGLRAGVLVEVEIDGHVPIRRVLDGKGPWTLRVPSTTLDLRADHDFVCVCGGSCHTSEKGRITLRGLPPGPHVILVGARGKRTRAIRVVLKEGEPRRFDLP